MKKIFTLLTLMMVSLQLMAVDGNASDAYLNIANYATIDQAGATVSGMSKIYKYTEYEDQECAWLTVSYYGAQRADATQNWYNYEGTEKNAEGSWTATDIFLGSSSYFTGTAYYCNWNEAYQNFYVTNCSQVKQLSYNIQSSYNTGNVYPLKMEIYECTLNANGTLTEGSSTVDYKTTQTTNQNEVLSSIDLDPSKIYKVRIYNDYSRLYEIAFKTPLENEIPPIEINTPVADEATEVTADGFIANWEPCEGAISYTLRFYPEAVRGLVFHDGFSKCHTNGTVEIGEDMDNYCDSTGWWGYGLFEGRSGLIFDYDGHLETPRFKMPCYDKKMTIKFKAKPLDSNEPNCNLLISCGSLYETIPITGPENEYTIVTDLNVTAGGLVGSMIIVNPHYTDEGRVLMTDFKIYAGDITQNHQKAPTLRENVHFDGDTVFVEGVTETSYPFIIPTNNAYWFYDVKAVYENGQESDWSNRIMVTTYVDNYPEDIDDAVAGDVNGDGEVTSADITALYNFLLTGDDSEIVNGDQDEDGSITTHDVSVVYGIVLGVPE